MKKLLLIPFLLVLCFPICEAQMPDEWVVSIDYAAIDKFRANIIEETFAVIQHLEDVPHDIEPLSEHQLVDGILTLPVRFKNSPYGIILHQVMIQPRTGTYQFSGSFRIEDSYESTDFNLRAEMRGDRNGKIDAGELTLLTPARKVVGENATVYVHSGSKISFRGYQIEEANIEITWIEVSQPALPEDYEDYLYFQPETVAEDINNTEEQEHEASADHEQLIRSLIVYPNPTSGLFDVEIELSERSNIYLTLYDAVTGVRINSRQEGGMDMYTLNYDMSQLNPGAYLLVLTAQNQQKQAMIIKN